MLEDENEQKYAFLLVFLQFCGLRGTSKYMSLADVRSAIYYNAQPRPLGVRLSSCSKQPKSYPVKLIDQNVSLADLELITRYFLECLQKTTPSLIVLKVCQSGPDCESTRPRC